MLKDLTYKVIVIDDEEDLYEDYVEFIEGKLNSEGYKLCHKRYEELCDLEENIILDVDLFLVDLKFGKEDKGPDFIKKIRENQFTDILFYSSDSKTMETLRKSGDYQGVFFAIRDENKSEIYPMIEKLIQKMIMRANTPLSSRGIVLSCVAELDNLIKTKLPVLIDKISEEDQRDVLDKCLKIYYNSFRCGAKKHSDFWGYDFHSGIKKWEEIKNLNIKFDILELVNNIKLTDSNKNVKILLEIYKSINGKDSTYDSLNEMLKLLDDRNIFAHVQEEKNSDGIYQFKKLNGTEYLVLTKDKCRALRMGISNYCKILENL